MTNKITEIPFRGTPEQEAKLKEIIAQHKGESGAMMPVLQKAQEIYVYLPIEVQTMVAEGLGVSLEQVYGVSTFYHLLRQGFRRHPCGTGASARHQGRSYHERRQVYARSNALPRLLRSCSGYDDRRRRLRQTGSRRRQGHFGQIPRIIERKRV